MEFIKEKKKVRKQENTLSTKKAIKKKKEKQALGQESEIQEKTKMIKKKRRKGMENVN